MLLQIFNQYDIEDLVKRNLKQSIQDDSYKDLSQQIFLILFELPFSRLYYLLSRNQIPYYVIGIIKNQRQSPYLEYNKYFKCNSQELNYDIEYKEDDIPDNELQDKLDIINEVLYKNYPITDIHKFTYVQSAEFFCVEIYKLYLKKKSKSNYSFTKLSEELGINRNLISDSIQDSKDIIRREYYKKYGKKPDIDI